MSSVKVGSDDSIRVPKLESGGGNWVLYKARLAWAADAKGVLGNLDGTSKEPTHLWSPLYFNIPGPLFWDPILSVQTIYS